MKYLAQISVRVTLLLTLLIAFSQQAQAGSYIVYLHHDALGNVVAKSDENGNIISRETLTPFGKSLGLTDHSGSVTVGDTEHRTGYTGHVRDRDLGLTYMQARYYDPRIGRFMGVDPVSYSPEKPQMFNRYAYANNSPYRYVDPDGRFPDDGTHGDNALERYERGNMMAQIGAENSSVDVSGIAEYLPGAGLLDAYGSATTGDYLGIGIALASEIPVLKGLRVVKGASPNVKNVLDGIEQNGFKVKINPKNPATKQEVNATIDFGDKTKVNLRVESHPLKQGGPDVRHANIEVTRQIKNKNKVIRNDHIVD